MKAYFRAVWHSIGGKWIGIPSFTSGCIGLYGFFQHQFTGLPAMAWWAVVILALVPIVLWVIAGLVHRVVFLEWSLSKKLRISFEPRNSAYVHPAMLGNGKLGLLVRILPICETEASIENCQGHLNAVYRRRSEADRWEHTQWNERLFLPWGTIGFEAISLYPDILQYLDVVTIDELGIHPYVHQQVLKHMHVFEDTDYYYRLDIMVTGDQNARASISIQIQQTTDWEKPVMRVLAATELGMAN
jgi:hypothetical protein